MERPMEFGLHLRVVKIQGDTTVRGGVKVETTKARWTTGLAEPGWRPLRLAGGHVETTALAEPGRATGAGRTRWRPRGGGLSEHWTGGVSQVAEVETTKLSRSVLSCTNCR